MSAALALTVLLAHARFLGAYRAPPGAAAAAVAPDRTGTRIPEEGSPVLPPPDALRAGMAFLGDMLETADRIGKLRHQRRLRKLQRQQAERQVSAPSRPAPAERRLALRVRRDGSLWDHPRLPPPEWFVPARSSCRGGTFRVSNRAARSGVNPRNPSEKIKIPAMKVPVFKARKALKEAVR